ncbi:aminoglycoside phosphotransferase (APT) family kinase protein [Microbacterium halimionae]|uniref:Aminoglycoside phosphotransferase (APT) family kinase protein n=1 Tax=Microbacterium halimionae TaxID=1526413 RepID=A0A7W3JR76_9MICO|nr:phosphotransferase family protein [Microbacterium halimionae]MBA8817547.1 aminoglycoside phosphotransferase (APT) family kinase protein [Microbacterium halimionae]NII95010.1 aminoglycoside phosphotransferase (APT) family kinase protein [Microbacterium halimionae]
MTEVPGLDVAALSEWLRHAHPDLADRDLTASVIPGGRSNLTYAVDGARIPLVLRRPPLGHVLSSAHDMRREHRVISALADSPVPVPTAIDLVDDAERAEITGTVFFLMQRAPGQVLAHTSQNADYSPAGLRSLSIELVQHLADLHAVDPSSVGLEDFGRPDGYLARQLSTWRRQLDASRSRDTPILDGLQASLADDMPDSFRTGIVHGDYRLDNALVTGAGDHPRISAVLDWEMATLGDPLVDLGIFALYWDIQSLPGAFAGAVPSAVDFTAGYPTFDELLAAYADRSEIAVPNLRWYRAFAAYKLAVILEGIHFRYQAGDTVGEGFEQIGDLVEPLATRGKDAR